MRVPDDARLSAPRVFTVDKEMEAEENHRAPRKTACEKQVSDSEAVRHECSSLSYALGSRFLVLLSLPESLPLFRSLLSPPSFLSYL